MTTNQTKTIRFDGNLVEIPAIFGVTTAQNSQLQNVVNKLAREKKFFQ